MVSHETGQRIDKAMRSWGRSVLWVRAAFAMIGALIMAFGAVVFPDSRSVTIPGAIGAVLVLAYTLRTLRRAGDSCGRRTP